MTPVEASAQRVRELIAELRADRTLLASLGEELDAYVGSSAELPVRSAAAAFVLERIYSVVDSLDR